MDRALLKLAQQLNQYDESSLMELWNEYAGKVAHFEPSARWEEYALAFCMIQAVHWKNQLFNSELAASARRGQSDDKNLKAELASFSKNRFDSRPPSGDKADKGEQGEAGKKSVRAGGKKACKVLLFRPTDVSES